MPDLPIEQRFIVRGLSIAAQVWRPHLPKKIIALHGWLDNSASFNGIAPLLENYCVIALDLAGQGLSEHRPASATYHLWDDALDIATLIEQLDFSNLTLLGHSRGAMLASMLAASMPERIERLVLLDGIMPLPVAIEQSATQLRRYLDEYRNPRARHYFPDQDTAIRLRAKASAFEYDLAEQLATRQLRHDDKGWYWHIDERLKAASAVKMSEEHNQAFLAAIQCPVDIVMADGGMGKWPAIASLREQFKHFAWHDVEGHHHVHMTDSAKEIVSLCRL